MENNSMVNETPEQDFQIRAIVDQYLSYWRWFLLSAVLSLSIAYIYLALFCAAIQSSNDNFGKR